MSGVLDIRILLLAKRLAGDNFDKVVQEAVSNKQDKTPERALADSLHKLLHSRK